MIKIVAIFFSVFAFSLFSTYTQAKDWDHLLTQKIFSSDEKLIFLSCYYFLDSKEENESTKNYCDDHAKLITSIRSGFKEIQEPTLNVFFTNKNHSGMKKIFQVEVGGHLESQSNTIKRPNGTTVTNTETGAVDYFFSENDVILIILLTKEREDK